jgi:apolipoprotein N-acyltransferase
VDPAAGAEAQTAVQPRRRAWWRSRYLLLAICGVSLALGQAPFDLWPLALAGFFLAFAAFDPARATFRQGLAFAIPHFAVALHWIVEPFLVDVARHGWMAPFALIFVAIGMGGIWAAAFRLTGWLRGGAGTLALSLGVAELFRGYALTGFPWATPGYLWVETPVIQLASVTGIHGLTLLTMLGLALPVTAWHARRRLLALPLALAILPLAVLLLPTLEERETPVPATDAPLRLRLVQPNATQSLKWDPDWAPIFYQRLLDLTAASGPEAQPPDLVIWPETAVPYDLEGSPGLRENIADAARGGAVVLGYQRRDGAEVFNSLAVLGQGGEITARYDKQHLVPFGEYMPLGWLVGRLGIRGIAQVAEQGYSAGPGPQTLALGGAGRVLPLICYEAVFPQDLRAEGPRPDWLLQITNDAWFGAFSGPYQHLAQARVRAIEQGLPMVRVANTGVSAVIDADGRVVDSLPLDEAGLIDATLPPKLADQPLFAQLGDWPLLALYLLGLQALLWRRLSH